MRVNNPNELSVNNVLIVDDNDFNLGLLYEILTNAGYVVHKASSGELALKLVETKLPSIVLLDVRMPGLDGYEVCRILKADENTRDIPVIFISAFDDRQSILTGFEVGGVDFINKPFRKEEILARVKTHVSLFHLQLDLKTKNLKLEEEVLRRKQDELAIEKRLVALTKPLQNREDLDISELFDIAELLQLQDQFASAFGVASIITQPDGTPVTRPSNFSRLCQNIIRCTEKGRLNCMHSDSVIGRHHPEGPVVMPCLSGGLWDAGASITVGGQHVASWLIGQVRDKVQEEGKLKEYAREIGADETDFMKAFHEIPSMSQEQFHKIAEMLFTMAGQLSDMAFQNVQQARFINDRQQTEIALLESEERFRTTLYSIGDGVITTDAVGKVRLMNPIAEQLTGWTQQEASGKALEDVFRIFNEDTHVQVEVPVRRVLREGVIVGLANHTLLIAKDGTERPIADSGAPIRNEKGEIVGVVLVFRDQTEDRKAEKALRESEERFRSIIESSPIGKYIYRLQEDGRLIFMGANPSADRIIGIDHHTLMGKTIQQAFPDLAKTGVPEMYAQIAKGELPTQSFEIKYSENQINGFFQVTVFRIENNSIAVDFMDISDRKKTEIALRENEEKFRSLFENGTVGTSMTRIDGTMTINARMHEMLGYTEAEFRNKKWQEITHPEDIKKSEDFINTLINRQARQLRFEKRYLHKNGKIVWADVSTTLHCDENDQPDFFITSISDITDRKEAEESLRQNERKFRALIENSSDAISLVDSNGLEFYHSSSCEQILGFSAEERNGKSMMELIHPEDKDSLINMFTEILKNPGIAILLPTRVMHHNGSWIWIEGVANNLLADPDVQAIVINFRDVTERKQFEIKLQRSEQELKKAQQITHIGSWYLNLADNEVYWSEELYKMYGFDPNLPVPPYTEHKKLFTPESWELLSTSLANTAETGIPYELELKTVREDGSNGWMWVRGETIKDDTGKTVGLWGAAQDISARKQAEHALFESEEMMRNSQSVAHICSYSTTLNEREIGKSTWVCSPEFYKLFGIDKTYPHTIEGWVGFIHPDFREEVAAYHEYVIKERVPFEHEYKIIRIDDGAERWVYGTGKLELDEKGNPIRMHGAIQDITERKRAERAILDANQKMNSFFEQSLDGFFFMILDEPIDWVNNDVKEKLLDFSCSHLKISRVNDAILDQYGAELNQILGKCFLDFFAHDIEQGKDVLKKIFDNGKMKIETLEQKINGENMFIEGDYTCLYDSEGKITGLFGIQRDITQSKQAVEAIQNERQLLRTLIDNLPVTIYVKDNEGHKLVANKADLEVIGVETEAEVLGKTDLETFSHEIGQRGYEDDLKIIQTQVPVLNREEIFVDKNGSRRWLLTSKVPIIDLQGKTTGLVGIGRDITEQKKANETIQKLSKSIEQNPSSIVITDLNGNIEYVNPKFTEITGYSFDEAKGQNPRMLKSGEMSPEGYKNLWDTISSGEVWRGEFHNRKKNGELYWEWATMTSIKNEHGEITNYIAIKEDIGLRKQMEADLIVAKEKAEESDRLKSSFLANMSHEIRTPLNSIIGFSELLSDSDFEVDQKVEFIDHIILNGNNLLNIISDIVDISKIEAREITIRNSKIQVIQFLNQIRALHLINVEGKKLRLNLICDDSVTVTECFVFGDKERLQQIFNNLISNALKFTFEGYIELGCRVLGNMVEFHVKDTGIGIPADYHQKVFDRFRQVEASYTRKFGGNGLGLAISKNLIELMGGEIRVESELGKGATFYFTLPRS